MEFIFTFQFQQKLDNPFHVIHNEKYINLNLSVYLHMKDKKSKVQEEIDAFTFAFKKTVVTEQQIRANWKAIQDEIKRLEQETTKNK